MSLVTFGLGSMAPELVQENKINLPLSLSADTGDLDLSLKFDEYSIAIEITDLESTLYLDNLRVDETVDDSTVGIDVCN